ncbi:unnamed protein product [Rotaria sordida]|uniref:Uncharacterized protein n=1 Tax=Rotaria sordida TaxID=392033 RepID=A0A819SLH5_9BILA|nr:unnamed protein product [Rotaria sordida]CAF4053853.1 unnamed protein product [Rotaria sordida]
MELITFWDIYFKSDGDYKSYDELVQGALNDDCYQKVYPGVASESLLENLIKFVQNVNNRPIQDGVDHGTLYKKPNGRQIDSSRRYYLVKEPNLDEFNLYAKITKGRKLGYYRIYTNKDEVELLLEYGLNYLKQQATLPIVADYLQFGQDSKYLIARERCEFISRLLNNNVAAARENSKGDYDVTKLGAQQTQIKKCSKETAIASTVSSSPSPSTRQSHAQKQVLSLSSTTLSSSADEKSTSRSQSSSVERSQSPPPKKKTNNKLIKKQQQLSKTTTKKPAPTSYSRSTPILNRLRTKSNGRNAIASLSSTSSTKPVVIVTVSNNKQTVSAKKRGHSSESEDNDDNTPILHVPTTSADVKPVKHANGCARNKRRKNKH